MSPVSGAAGRRVVVLGATGTIGGAITRDLLAGGAKVVETGRSPKRLSELGAAGASVLPLALTGSTASSNALRDACGTALGDAIDGLDVTGRRQCLREWACASRAATGGEPTRQR